MRTLALATLVVAAQLPGGSAQKRTGSEEIVVEAPTRAPDKSLLDWHEYRSEHFWVDTDLPDVTVAALIESWRSCARRRFVWSGRSRWWFPDAFG